MKKTKNQKILNFAFVFCILIFGFWISCFAQEGNKLASLTKQIIEAQNNSDLYAPFSELKDIYFKENKYSEFSEFLTSLLAKNKALEPFIDYYTALSRYQQLKYLEEKQNWDEYFSQGNNYRDQVAANLEKTISLTAKKDPLHIYGQLLLWQFHRDQQDAFEEEALLNLMNYVAEYAKDTSDIQPIKLTADQLASYGEKGKSKELYKIFVDKMLASNITEEELSKAALEFYKQANLDLSEVLYDAYIARITKPDNKEKVIPILIDIAKAFSYKDNGPSDMSYAEQIFQKIEELGSDGVFDEALMYLRAYNLEKAKEYRRARDTYLELVKIAPEGAHVDEAEYKVGIIYVYVLKDIKTGKDYFEKLAQKETLSPQGASALYQLGLLAQWENDFVKAKEYYNKLLERAKEGFPDTVALAKARLKEIDAASPIDYNLQAFLGASLKEDSINIDAAKSNLSASLYAPKKDQETKILSGSYELENGCMQVELQYLWSGELGKITVPSEQLSLSPALNTSYADAGTKVINVLIVSPTGAVDRGLVMVDVY
ncbi:MAG: hypothetical protein PHQ57_04595 [Candidatus Omnitrophica bacterium]|nr:hypothetical protein [Candidatus Omnitrophota bacterium]